MRALTLLFPLIFFSSLHTSRNEVLAREGIDTFRVTVPQKIVTSCRNEVLAREGIDTDTHLRIHRITKT